MLDFLVENGVVKDENLPFTGVKDITTQTKGKVYKLDSWGSIDVSSYSLDERKEIIKKCLLENGPIVTTISFYNDLKDYSGGIYECDESSGVISGHWVTIIGWSDDDSIASGGYGLGLYIVGQIAELHQWDIRCISEDGVFKVLISKNANNTKHYTEMI